MESEDAYVYVIGGANEKSPLKIGHSRHPKARLTDIQSANFMKLRIMFQRRIDRGWAYRVEQSAHAVLWAHRAFREWFNVSLEQAVAAILLAEEAAADGRTISPAFTFHGVAPFLMQRFRVRLPADVDKRLTAYAHKMEITDNAAFLVLVHEGLKHWRPEPTLLQWAGIE